MAPIIGILCAFIAMFAWGFGDFLIQRSTRWIGDWETLFLISIVGAIILAPFSLGTALVLLQTNAMWILSIASAVLLLAALLEFEALREGKLAVVESLWSAEIITSALLAFLILGEQLSMLQIGIIVALILGLVLVSMRRFSAFKKSLLEKASLLALISALVMGAANFLFGLAARATDPLATNFVTAVFLAVCSGAYLIAKGKMKPLMLAVYRSPRRVVLMTILDNIAWVAFAFAMTLAPIGIAVALSESYIIIAVILGLFINREKLQTHQKVGLVVAVVAAVTLASMTI